MKTVPLILFALLLSGCAQWSAERFDISKLRDERAADLDERLSKPPKAVEHKFESE